MTGRLFEALGRRTGPHMSRRGGLRVVERWQPADSLRRGLLLGIGAVALGALVHRPDMVLIGTPLLLSTFVAIGRIQAVTLTLAALVSQLPRMPTPALVEVFALLAIIAAAALVASYLHRT